MKLEYVLFLLGILLSVVYIVQNKHADENPKRILLENNLRQSENFSDGEAAVQAMLERIHGKKTKMDDRQYYLEDVNGDYVLSLESVDEKDAKRIWRESPIYVEMIKVFPDFLRMKAFAREYIAPCEFREQLLKKLDEVEASYIGGSINFIQVKKRLAM